MNWIIYVSLSVIKLLIISSLVLLTVCVLPMLLVMFALGMLLGNLRDVEPRLNSSKLYSNEHRYSARFSDKLIAHASWSHLKSIWMFIFSHIIAWAHHSIITRDKTIS